MPFTRNEIIEGALELIGVKPANEDAQAADVITAANALNTMVKAWGAKGLHLFSREDATLFLQPGQVTYQLGSTTTDHATENFTGTTLSAAAVATDTVLNLTSSTGMAVNDIIGVKLDTGFVHWSTVTVVAPVTIATQMPSNAASGNTVYFYTTDIGKPLRVPSARRQTGVAPNAQEIEMVVLSHSDYENLPNKTTTGTPVQFYYDPQQIFGRVNVWPAPTSVDTLINMTIWKELNVYTTAADQGVFPSEWGEALIYNLAIRLGPRYGAAQMSPLVVEQAVSYLDDLLAWDQGSESLYFQYGQGRGQ